MSAPSQTSALLAVAGGRSRLRGRQCVGYCAPIVQRDSPMPFSRLLMRQSRGHASWRWRP